MQKSIRYIMTVLVLGSFLLSACAGAAPQGDDSGGSPDANSNEVIDVDGNVNDNDSDVNENGNDAQDNGNDNNDNGDDMEFHGVVDAITDTSIVIDGVEYNLSDFTEIKDLVSVGDQVKIQVIVNADGTFTIREIELSSGDDDDNSNGNSNSNDNDNDDNDNDNSNDDDDNSNDSNSNDDDDDDDDDKDDDNNNDD